MLLYLLTDWLYIAVETVRHVRAERRARRTVTDVHRLRLRLRVHHAWLIVTAAFHDGLSKHDLCEHLLTCL
jgi:hypothetical protein